MIARIHHSLAQLDTHQGQHEAALDHIRQALDLFRRLGMRQEQAEAEALLRQLGAQP